MLTLEKASLQRIAKDIDVWCDVSAVDFHRCMYLLGPFDGLNSHLIQELVNILSDKKQLKVSHLHVFLHSNIKHLDFSVCSSLISDQVLGIMGIRCKKITHLSLKNCRRLTTKALKEISRNLPLQSLDLSGCVACTDGVLECLGEFCPQLRILRVESCSQVTDAGVAALCGDESNPSCRGLREVNFASTKVTNTGLHLILSTQCELQRLSIATSTSCEIFYFCDLSVTRLTSMDLSHTSVTDSSVSNLCKICPLLSELSLNCCPAVTGISLRSIAALPYLKCLNIAGNSAVKFQRDLEEFLKTSGGLLEILDISGMDSVDTAILGSHCRSLRRLIMADCTNVSGNFITVPGQQSEFMSLAKACHHLEFLNLHCCQFSHHESTKEHLFAILSSSVNLRELDLSAIEDLGDDVILPLAQSSAFSCLYSLNLSRSCEVTVESVEPIVSACKSLTRLDLSHCQNISRRDADNLRRFSKERGCGVKILWV